MSKETLEFQAETKQLLDLMINSIYTNREIFLRELISNASDAIDKLHFASLTNRELLEGDEDYEIFLVPDAASHTLTISDNGIGMTREEVIENLGTIAKSGTKAFLEQMKKAKEENQDISDKDLIGQFGVGFYSAFMVAEKVTVVTRKAGTQQAVRWESTAERVPRHDGHAHAGKGFLRGFRRGELHGELEAAESCEEVFGLCALSDQDEFRGRGDAEG